MKGALALLAFAPVVVATAIAGVVSSPSKVRPCITGFSDGLSSGPNHLELGPDGALWSNEQNNRIARFDLQTKKATEVRVPDDTQLHELETGPDGNLWFTGLKGRLGRLDVETRKVTLFPGIDPESQPHHLWWGPDAKAYVSEFLGGRLARFDPKTRRVTELRYNLPPDRGIHGYVELPDHTTWWALQNVDQIARFDTRTQRFDSFVQLPSGSGPHWLEYVPSENAIWVALAYANDLIRYDLDTGRVERFDLGLRATTATELRSRAPVPTLTFMMLDAAGRNLWLADLAGGEAVRFDLETHVAKRVGCGFRFPSFTITLANDSDGNLWITESPPPGRGGTPPGPGRLALIRR